MHQKQKGIGLPNNRAYNKVGIMKKELSLQDYFNLIIRRRKVIIAATVGVVAATLCFLLIKPSVYQATTSFMLESKEITFSEKGMGFTDQTRPLGYYEAIMRSRHYRNRLLDSLQLNKHYFEADYSAEELAELAAKKIHLSSAQYSDMIILTAQAPEPKLAFSLAVHATSILKERCMEVDREELSNAVQFIDHQKDISQQNLETAERALQEFKKKTNVIISEEDGGMMNELVKMENAMTTIQTERELAQANLNAYRQRLSQLQGRETTGNGYQDSPEIQKSRNHISELEKQKNDLVLQYGETDNRVMAIDTKLEKEKRHLVNLMIQSSSQDVDLSGEGDMLMWKNIQEKMIQEELNVFILQNRERYHKKLVEDFKKKNPQMMEHAIELMRMTRAQSVAENLYAFLLEKGEEAKIKEAAGSGGMRIIDYPVLPKQPIPSQMVRNIVLTLFLGLGLGFGIALIQEYLDNSIQTKEDITQNSSLSVLGMVPSLNGFSKNPLANKLGSNGKHRNPEVVKAANNGAYLINHLKLKSPAVESYRTLRSNLNFASVDQGIRDIVVSSANPSEGKTLTSANLAIAYAMLGKNVLLIDTDLRKPRQHKVFKIDQKPGLTDYLLSNSRNKIKVYPTEIDNLKMIPCGEIPPNPAEILASQRMTDFMKDIREHFDVVIYDTAPILPVSDTSILAPKVDGLLLVVKHASTDKRDLTHALETLDKSNAKIFGVVMNNVVASRGYGYYYTYYNKSYYTYS